jgi:hypothetical protein
MYVYILDKVCQGTYFMLGTLQNVGPNMARAFVLGPLF